jgi:hypothetical protein
MSITGGDGTKIESGSSSEDEHDGDYYEIYVTHTVTGPTAFVSQ